MFVSLFHCSGEEMRLDREKILRALLMTELWDLDPRPLWHHGQGAAALALGSGSRGSKVVGWNWHLYICIIHSAAINIYLHKGQLLYIYICLIWDDTLYSANWNCTNNQWDQNGLTHATDKLQMWPVLPAW